MDDRPRGWWGDPRALGAQARAAPLGRRPSSRGQAASPGKGSRQGLWGKGSATAAPLLAPPFCQPGRSILSGPELEGARQCSADLLGRPGGRREEVVQQGPAGVPERPPSDTPLVQLNPQGLSWTQDPPAVSPLPLQGRVPAHQPLGCPPTYCTGRVAGEGGVLAEQQHCTRLGRSPSASPRKLSGVKSRGLRGPRMRPGPVTPRRAGPQEDCALPPGSLHPGPSPDPGQRCASWPPSPVTGHRWALRPGERAAGGAWVRMAGLRGLG